VAVRSRGRRVLLTGVAMLRQSPEPQTKEANHYGPEVQCVSREKRDEAKDFVVPGAAWGHAV